MGMGNCVPLEERGTFVLEEEANLFSDSMRLRKKSYMEADFKSI